MLDTILHHRRYIPLPCVLTDPVLKSLLSYMEVSIVLFLLGSAWLYARHRKSTGSLTEQEAWAEYFLSVLFSLLFTFGMRASITLFIRYDEDLLRQVLSRLAAPILPGFLLFLLLRFSRLLQEHREAASKLQKATSTQTKVNLEKQARFAAEAVRFLIERYADDQPSASPPETRKSVKRGSSSREVMSGDELTRIEGWPLCSQWQLVVWTRQLLLCVIAFAMECVVRLTSSQVQSASRYVATVLTVVTLGGFWRLHAKRQPYSLRDQHWLEVFFFAIDIIAVIAACAYGALTQDGTDQDATGRVTMEFALASLLCTSVLIALLIIGFGVARERWYIKRWYLQHGLVQALNTTVAAERIIDLPIENAIRDGAIRIIDCDWLMDTARSNPWLPRVTKVVAHISVGSARFSKKELARTLATHCEVSAVCITIEHVGSSSSPPPSPPADLEDVQEVQRRPSFGHVTRLQRVLADAGLSQLAHPLVYDLGIEKVDELCSYSYVELVDGLQAEAGVTLKMAQAKKLKAFCRACGATAYWNASSLHPR